MGRVNSSTMGKKVQGSHHALSVSILQLVAEQREDARRGRRGVSEPFYGTRELVDEWRRATSVDFDTRPLVESTRRGQYCFCSTAVFLTSADE
jgi:hypothetical protein